MSCYKNSISPQVWREMEVWQWRMGGAWWRVRCVRWCERLQNSQGCIFQRFLKAAEPVVHGSTDPSMTAALKLVVVSFVWFPSLVVSSRVSKVCSMSRSNTIFKVETKSTHRFTWKPKYQEKNHDIFSFFFWWIYTIGTKRENK